MTLHIETAGAGPDLVLLHGWGMHGGAWDAVRGDLARRFRLHIADLPGCGKSPPCEPYTLEGIARLLAAALPQKIAVCGWSLGGLVALRWALAAPQQVERLILVAATPRFAQGEDWPHGVAPHTLRAFAQDLRHDPGGTLKRFFSLQAQGDSHAREVMRQLRASLAQGLPCAAALEGGLRILRESDLRGEAEKIGQRALVLHGERDALTPPAAGRWLARHLPQARFAPLAGAAHAPFLSQGEAFCTRIAEFCDER